MSIKYAILGLLAEAPNHGYAVHAAFEERLSDFWELNYGQVYQILTVLEREGLITGRDERVGKRPPRKVYSATSRGQAALHNWLLGAGDRRRPFRDEFYVRFLFADATNSETLAAMIDAEIARCRERLADLTDRRDSTPKAQPNSYVPRLFAAAAVRHAEADLESLQECKATVLQLLRVTPEPRARAKSGSGVTRAASGKAGARA